MTKVDLLDQNVRAELAQIVLESLMDYANGTIEIEGTGTEVKGPLGGYSSQVYGHMSGRKFVVSVYCDDRTNETDDQ